MISTLDLLKSSTDNRKTIQRVSWKVLRDLLPTRVLIFLTIIFSIFYIVCHFPSISVFFLFIIIHYGSFSYLRRIRLIFLRLSQLFYWGSHVASWYMTDSWQIYSCQFISFLSNMILLCDDFLCRLYIVYSVYRWWFSINIYDIW